MCRAGCLPVLKRVAREAKLQSVFGTCNMCNSGNIEDIEHFVMDCDAYSIPRSKMLTNITFDESWSQEHKLDILLGKSTGTSKMDDMIDMAVKRFLKKAWRSRKWLVLNTNRIFDRNDTPWAVQAHGDDVSPSFIIDCRSATKSFQKPLRC